MLVLLNVDRIAANSRICESTNKKFRKYSLIGLIYEGLFLNRELNTSLKYKMLGPDVGQYQSYYRSSPTSFTPS